MTRPIVENNIALSLRRMGVERLDLLQFHWWDYEDSAYLEALTHLASLRDAGKIKHLALTNFDTAHVQTIAEHGIRIVSNQVQYSLDLGPEVRMAPFARSTILPCSPTGRSTVGCYRSVSWAARTARSPYG
jgi:aryl-alcohol dehydrogenase-like predicted oxidoreductase